MRFIDQQVTRPVTTRAAVDVEAVKLWLGSECIEVKESFHHAVSLGDEKLRGSAPEHRSMHAAIAFTEYVCWTAASIAAASTRPMY